MATEEIKQKWFNAIATILWPQHTGDIWPGDVTMKLMEIGHEWRNSKIDEAAQLCGQAEEMPDAIGIDVAAMLEKAHGLVERELGTAAR